MFFVKRSWLFKNLRFRYDRFYDYLQLKAVMASVLRPCARGDKLATKMNQQTGELISDTQTSQEYNNKDLSRLSVAILTWHAPRKYKLHKLHQR